MAYVNGKEVLFSSTLTMVDGGDVTAQVLEEINNINNNIAAMSEELDNEQKAQNSRIDRNDKRITNLEKGIPSELFATDNGVAYIKDVPENALPFAEISKIGGMTYKDGDTLESALVTEVKSVGINILGGDVLADRLVELANGVKDKTTGIVRFYAGDVSGKLILDGFKPNTTYTFILNGWNEYGAGTNLMLSYTDDTIDYISFPNSQALGTTVFQSKSGKSIKGLFGVMYASHTNLCYNKCGVFEGAITAEAFVPYQEEFITITEAVQNLDGYGWGVNKSVYNYIDFVKQLFVKRVGCVDMGTLNWVGGGNVFQAYAPKLGYKEGVNAICSKYDIVNTKNVDKTLYMFDSYYGVCRIAICDSAYTDAATFKAAMSGVMLYYELAESVITDISDILPEDNFIGVEGNGTITFINEHKTAVPSEITYMLMEA